jgi:phosphoribosylanthranilate isomerase
VNRSSRQRELFRIKICGVTRAADAERAVELGADAIGLNLFSGSSRFLSLLAAREVRDAIPSHVAAVGVFVDFKFSEVCRAADALELDYVQLHGSQLHESELPEFAMALQALGHRVIRALRCGASGAADVTRYVDQCYELDAMPSAILLDADSKRGLGGTGELASWTVAAELLKDPLMPPIILAGGLNAGNIASALQAVPAAAVDTASGVESAPGIKDAEQMAAFISAARRELDELAKRRSQ